MERSTVTRFHLLIRALFRTNVRQAENQPFSPVYTHFLLCILSGLVTLGFYPFPLPVPNTLDHQPQAAKTKTASPPVSVSRPQGTGLGTAAGPCDPHYITEVEEAVGHRFYYYVNSHFGLPGKIWYQITGRNDARCIPCIKSFAAGESDGTCWALQRCPLESGYSTTERCKRCVQGSKCTPA